jgi:hypothetical protein
VENPEGNLYIGQGILIHRGATPIRMTPLQVFSTCSIKS